jgi:ABC-type molybdate transport system substrate-binding protein
VGRYVAIPESEYPPIKQAAIIVASSKNKATARLFLDFLKKPEIVNVMETYGFGVSLK